MDKLEYLLNEYEPWIAKDGEYKENIRLYRAKSEDKIVRDNATRYIVSKEYKFIERLISKDKIDMDKLDSRYSKVEYEPLLMLLAIQDNPIDFLISVLK